MYMQLLLSIECCFTTTRQGHENQKQMMNSQQRNSKNSLTIFNHSFKGYNVKTNFSTLKKELLTWETTKTSCTHCFFLYRIINLNSPYCIPHNLSNDSAYLRHFYIQNKCKFWIMTTVITIQLSQT